jgi:molecular chaperone DnaK (HSP70)
MIGLDFGTSTTLVASSTGVLPIGASQPWMPSLVGYRDDGSIVTGEATDDVAAEQIIRSIKRSITGDRHFAQLDLPSGVREVRTDDLVVELFQEMARRSAAAGHDLARAPGVRLGCPAMWDRGQRDRLIGIARRAGLKVTLADLIDEPVAAGIAWLSNHAVDAAKPMRVVVFDMGGGTLDIAVLDVRGAHGRDVAVLAAVGVAEAGDDLDRALARDLDNVLAVAGVDVDSLSHRARARLRLLHAAREAKHALTTETETDIVLPRQLFGITSVLYTRAQLEEVFLDQIQRAEAQVVMALMVARLSETVSGTAGDIARTPWDDLAAGVDVVLLSGGMSQIPYVAERLGDLFGPTTRVELAADPADNAVVLGLARAAGFGRINMYRPAFDVVLEWDRGRQNRTVYEAFTPLVAAEQIRRGDAELRYVRDAGDLALPRRTKGRLRLVSHSDDPVRATIGGADLDGYALELSDKFEFALYPNGRIRVVDATGAHDGRIEGWHTPTSAR